MNKAKAYKIGSKVNWKWMGYVANGKILKIYCKPITKEFRGTVFKWNGSVEKPAYMIRTDAAHDVIKLQTELFI